MYASDPAPAETDSDVPDSIPDQTQLDSYFRSIDLENCDNISKPPPFDCTTMIPKDVFLSATPEFRKVWRSQDRDVQSHKAKKDKEQSVTDLREGAIYLMFADISTRSDVKIMYNWEVF